ncbi:MAG TPA: cadherin-like beta sandwich domain-containing protein [Lachnospiraceae bacterium]|nr:cadherin-like beta sandwich domain-containing protein [Lachnospiraceae bacterium]
MGNLVLNKPATASSYVLPYQPSRALDGTLEPTSRWLCNQLPGYMMVNLGTQCWMDRWVVRHMPKAGWKLNGNETPYCMSTYELQGSNDGTNWTSIDKVTSNTVSETDRKFSAVAYQYVRLYVTKGLNANPQVASCMEFEVYEATPTSSNLSGLTISAGTLTPDFSPSVVSYTTDVDNGVTTISVTPTAEDPQATITVNGTVVSSGSSSLPITLDIGANQIFVIVTSKVGGVRKQYTVSVDRQPNNYLSSVTLTYKGRGFSEVHTVTMNHTDVAYIDSVSSKASTVSITPYAEDTSVKIQIGNFQLQSGQTSEAIATSATTNITISVSDVKSIGTREYTLTITEI